MSRAKLELTAMRGMLGDPEGAALLGKIAVSTDSEEATGANAWQLMIAFIKAGKDPVAQDKVVVDLHNMAQLHPEQDMITEVCDLMSQGAANDDIRKQVEDIVQFDLKGPLAQHMASGLEGKRRLRAILNKPFVVEGAKLDGTKFSSESYKGKVILVDIWATWCGPCLQELPRIKRIYADFHAKGLEMIGISCDYDSGDLKGFLSQNPDMSWPELFDKTAASHTEFHSLAKQWGVEGIPTLFLIDRKGILRSVTARNELETMLPKLIEEKAE